MIYSIKVVKMDMQKNKELFPASRRRQGRLKRCLWVWKCLWVRGRKSLDKGRFAYLQCDAGGDFGQLEEGDQILLVFLRGAGGELNGAAPGKAGADVPAGGSDVAQALKHL